MQEGLPQQKPAAALLETSRARSAAAIACPGTHKDQEGRALHVGTYAIAPLSPPQIGWRAFTAALPPPLNAIACWLQ